MVRNSRRQHNMQSQPKYTKNKEDYPEPRNVEVASASENINLLIKDVKKKNPDSKLRRLTNSIENNVSINKRVIISNLYHYQ